MHRQPRRYMFLLCFVSDWLSSDMPVAYCTFTLSHDTLFAKNSHNSIHFLPFYLFYLFTFLPLHHDVPCRASQQEGDDVTNHLKNRFPCLAHLRGRAHHGHPPRRRHLPPELPTDTHGPGIQRCRCPVCHRRGKRTDVGTGGPRRGRVKSND